MGYKSKTEEENGLAYQIEEEGTGDEKMAAISVFRCNGRIARTQGREMRGNDRMVNPKDRMFVLWKEKEKGRELFKNFVVRGRRDSCSQPIRACHVSLESETLQSVIEETFLTGQNGARSKISSA